MISPENRTSLSGTENDLQNIATEVLSTHLGSDSFEELAGRKEVLEALKGDFMNLHVADRGRLKKFFEDNYPALRKLFSHNGEELPSTRYEFVDFPLGSCKKNILEILDDTNLKQDKNEVFNDIFELRSYASKKMLELFSENTKKGMRRDGRIALAESQYELGLGSITPEIIEALRKASKEPIDYQYATIREEDIRHDVMMSHIYEFDKHIPLVFRGKTHQGATSEFINGNIELLQMKLAVEMLKKSIVHLISNFRKIAEETKDIVTLGFTHYQPAIPTTVGKRTTLVIQDLLWDLENLENLKISARGAKGTTGTQASYMTLFDDDYEKVKQLDKLVAQKMGFDEVIKVTSQTYPRKIDSLIANAVGGIATTLEKYFMDLRLLSNQQVVDEPFGVNQVGSSAMPFKRNPMRSERIGSFGRKLRGLVPSFHQTAVSNILERSLDDSAIRRIDIPHLFLTADSILKTALNVTNQDLDPEKKRPLTFYRKTIEKQLNKYIEFMATEKILMDLVKKGGNRQEIYHILKKHSVAAGIAMKQEGIECDLFQRLATDKDFPMTLNELQEYIKDSSLYAGAAILQTEEYLKDVVDPILEKYAHLLAQKQESELSV